MRTTLTMALLWLLWPIAMIWWLLRDDGER